MNLGIEYTRLRERTNDQLPLRPLGSEHDARQMILSIIEPLRRWGGVAEFHRQVNDTLDRLQRGKLKNPREVEVNLIFNVRVSIANGWT